MGSFERPKRVIRRNPDHYRGIPSRLVWLLLPMLALNPPGHGVRMETPVNGGNSPSERRNAAISSRSWRCAFHRSRLAIAKPSGVPARTIRRIGAARPRPGLPHAERAPAGHSCPEATAKLVPRPRQPERPLPHPVPHAAPRTAGRHSAERSGARPPAASQHALAALQPLGREARRFSSCRQHTGTVAAAPGERR